MRVLLLGSCVTRDAFEYQPEGKPLELVEYFARSALASATHPTEFTGVDVDRIESPFQRRIVGWDLTGAFMDAVRSAEYDLLVYDLIDERFQVIENADGALATRSNEFVRSGYDPTGDRVIMPGSPEAIDLWRAGWDTLTGALRDRGRMSALRINRTLWATEVEGGEPMPENYPPERIAAGNAYLRQMYAHAARDLPPHQFYDFAGADMVGSPGHRWGKGPYHYVDSYYQRLVNLMANDVVTR